MKGESVNFIVDSKDKDVFYKKKVLSNGQCAIFFVVRDRDDYGFTSFYIAFAIANKFKTIKKWFRQEAYGDLDVTLTGRCGLEGLLWARKCVEDTEKLFFSEYGNSKARIVVEGTTSSRYRVYKKYLSSLGFKECISPWGYNKCLIKTGNLSNMAYTL